MPDSTLKPKKSSWSWLLWWQIDPAGLNEQVEKYGSLTLFKSARGQSVLCLAFSAVLTAIVVVTAVIPTFDSYVYLDAALFAILAAFIYFGHRWAMLAAMVLWTFEKGVAVVTPITIGGRSVAPIFLTQFIWWAVYMHAFYFAFRVEQEKRKRSAVAITSQLSP